MHRVFCKQSGLYFSDKIPIKKLEILTVESRHVPFFPEKQTFVLFPQPQREVLYTQLNVKVLAVMPVVSERSALMLTR